MTALTGTPGVMHTYFTSTDASDPEVGFRLKGLEFRVWGLGLGLRLFWVSETILVILEAERLQKS